MDDRRGMGLRDPAGMGRCQARDGGRVQLCASNLFASRELPDTTGEGGVMELWSDGVMGRHGDGETGGRGGASCVMRENSGFQVWSPGVRDCARWRPSPSLDVSTVSWMQVCCLICTCRSPCGTKS